MSFQKFTGNCTGNVNKVAKYSIRSAEGVVLEYDSKNDIRWHLTTEEHLELIKMVNSVKLAHSDKPNGVFYINEYHHVIVPVKDGDGSYYLAGTYSKPLMFDFDGKIISGKPVGLDEISISPGDDWQGSRVGIRYRLSAQGNDIYYKKTQLSSTGDRGTMKIFLSKYIDREKVSITASLIRKYKECGGIFYVNEFRCLFAPIEKQTGLEYIYIGKLDMDNWFPNPHPVGGGDDDT